MNRTDRARMDVHVVATSHRVRVIVHPDAANTWTCVQCPAGTPATTGLPQVRTQ